MVLLWGETGVPRERSSVKPGDHGPSHILGHLGLNPGRSHGRQQSQQKKRKTNKTTNKVTNKTKGIKTYFTENNPVWTIFHHFETYFLYLAKVWPYLPFSYTPLIELADLNKAGFWLPVKKNFHICVLEDIIFMVFIATSEQIAGRNKDADDVWNRKKSTCQALPSNVCVCFFILIL